MNKVVKYLCQRCILDMQQCPMEPINVGPHSTLSLGTLRSTDLLLIAGSINGYKLLIEEDF